MSKKVLKPLKKLATDAASVFRGEKTVVDAPLNPMLSVSSNMEKENREIMRKRMQSGSSTILSDTLG